MVGSFSFCCQVGDLRFRVQKAEERSCERPDMPTSTQRECRKVEAGHVRPREQSRVYSRLPRYLPWRRCFSWFGLDLSCFFDVFWAILMDATIFLSAVVADIESEAAKMLGHKGRTKRVSKCFKFGAGVLLQGYSHFGSRKHDNQCGRSNCEWVGWSMLEYVGVKSPMLPT